MMRVVVICEDHTLDAYILKPVVEQIFSEAGRPARVQVSSNPRVQGYPQATNPAILEKTYENHPMADLFILVLDADCKEDERADALEQRLQTAGESGVALAAVLAIQEVEVWALALHKDKLRSAWQDVRDDCDPKEHYFEPFIQLQGWRRSPGKGRSMAMRPLKTQWASLKRRCPEVQQLCDDVQAFLDAQGAD